MSLFPRMATTAENVPSSTFFCRRGLSPAHPFSSPILAAFPAAAATLHHPSADISKEEGGRRCLIVRGGRRILSLSDTLPGGREREGGRKKPLAIFLLPPPLSPLILRPKKHRSAGIDNSTVGGFFWNEKCWCGKINVYK